MASTTRGFYVARQVDGRWQVASKTGRYLPGVGAAHPLVAGMTETDHHQIERAVCWMGQEGGINYVDLTADASYRVGWM